MVQIIHIVGEQGVGKSSLVEGLARREAARGNKTASFLEGSGVTRAQALDMAHGADVIYLECLRRDDVDARPGELVITLERVAMAPALGNGTRPLG